MNFYLATRRLFPRNYHLRIFAVCFGAVHLPLIAFMIAEAVRGSWSWATFVPLLLATLVGTVAAIAALHALLAPVRHAAQTLRRVEREELVMPDSLDGTDLAADLLASVRVAASATARRLDQLRDVAQRDLLTGLRNRRGFLDCAGNLRAGTRATLALIDIDHFKRVNDLYGHDEGDLVLQEFAHRLAEGMRRADLVARWGGEEFAVLIPEMGPSGAAGLIERLRDRLRVDPVGPDPASPVTFSCGLAFFFGTDEFDTAMRRADKALYAAKRAGRDRVVVAEERAIELSELL